MIKKEEKKSKLKIFSQNSKGQVTIFIIIAVLIIALGVLIYMFWPKIVSSVSRETKNPSLYIQECMEEKIQDTIETISLQGGTINPETYYIYERNKIEYLCYTNKNYEPCVVQQPLLVSYIQSEILNEIEDETVSCFNSLVESYKKKGYDVTLKKGNPVVQIVPNVISTKFNRTLTLVKGGESEIYETFEINLNSNLYKMLNIATGIVYWETTQGGAPIDTFMDLYDLKIEKQLQLDGTKIYIISEFGSGKDKFQFASRSFVRPQGITL